MSDSSQPHELQHARPPCPLPTPWAYPNSCPLSRWCHPTISSAVVPFSSCLQCGKYYFWYSFIGFLMFFQWLQLVIHIDYCYKNQFLLLIFMCAHHLKTQACLWIYYLYLLYTYTCTDIRKHIYIQICICIYTCMHENMSIYRHTYIYKCMYTHKWKHAQSKHMCTCPHVHIHFCFPCFVPDILENIMETIIYLSFSFLSIVVYVSSLKYRRLYSDRKLNDK